MTFWRTFGTLGLIGCRHADCATAKKYCLSRLVHWYIRKNFLFNFSIFHNKSKVKTLYGSLKSKIELSWCSMMIDNTGICINSSMQNYKIIFNQYITIMWFMTYRKILLETFVIKLVSQESIWESFKSIIMRLSNKSQFF